MEYNILNWYGSNSFVHLNGIFVYVFLNLILVFDAWCISCEIAFNWMPMSRIYDKSTLVQVMVWYRQATNHYQSKCWTRFLSPYASLDQNELTQIWKLTAAGGKW